MNWDVAVFGGGLAGVSAAVNAKRAGKKVILIEQNSIIGGNATLGLVNPFMRFWIDGKVLVGDFFQEIMADLESKGALFENCFDSEMLKIVLLEKLEGVTLLFRAIPIDVLKEGKFIKKVVVKTSLGNCYTIEANLFVDATGDGTLSYLAGCEFQSGDEFGENQAVTLMFVLGNVDFEKIRNNIRKDPENFYKWVSADSKVLSVAGYFKEIKHARKEGMDLPNDFFFFTQLPGTGRVSVNTTHISIKTTDDFQLSSAIKNLHKQVNDVYRFAKKFVPGFENSYIEKIATIPGVRESRRVVGLYIFSGKDVQLKMKFKDAAVKACYGIDIHRKNYTVTEEERTAIPKYEDYYEIPIRSLISKDFENLAVIGRNFSSDFPGQSAARIMPSCIDMGEAIGKFAGRVSKSFYEPAKVRGS
jgi:hypothetical protein